MKNIKFRAWERNEDPSFDHMVVEKITLSRVIGDHIRNQRTQQSGRYPYFSDSKQTYEIMQYTGLKDKNGVEVYEGDIVKDEFRKNVTGQEDINIGVIKFYSPSFYVCPPNASKFIIPFNQNILVENSVNFSVIGNIYQNPELLN